MRATASLLAALAIALAGGCDEDDEFAGAPDPATERRDPPADPPPGWRTLANRAAGFTMSVPREWTARTRRGATLIRSSDRLLAVTVAADRSEPGRTTPAPRYARRAFRALPAFRRVRATRARTVPRSPYPNGRVDGTGTLAATGGRQRISVTAFRRPGRVTYTVVAFSARLGSAPVHSGPLGVMLASLRARAPRG
ncbi:MAG TPA: hypothetical protein VD790_00750 [Thermoleophilaceae bacterium]|nr:hypothetical protein [Thermoleophilaceae bacterium]